MTGSVPIAEIPAETRRVLLVEDDAGNAGNEQRIAKAQQNRGNDGEAN